MLNLRSYSSMQFVEHTDKISTIEGLLTQQQCHDLILFSEQRGYEEAAVSLPEGAQMMKGLRNNYRLIFEDKNLANTFYPKIANYLPVIENNWVSTHLGKTFRFYRYDVEQRFKRHIDGRVNARGQEKSPNLHGLSE